MHILWALIFERFIVVTFARIGLLILIFQFSKLFLFFKVIFEVFVNMFFVLIYFGQIYYVQRWDSFPDKFWPCDLFHFHVMFFTCISLYVNFVKNIFQIQLWFFWMFLVRLPFFYLALLWMTSVHCKNCNGLSLCSFITIVASSITV